MANISIPAPTYEAERAPRTVITVANAAKAPKAFQRDSGFTSLRIHNAAAISTIETPSIPIAPANASMEPSFTLSLSINKNKPVIIPIRTTNAPAATTIFNTSIFLRMTMAAAISIIATPNTAIAAANTRMPFMLILNVSNITHANTNAANSAPSESALTAILSMSIALTISIAAATVISAPLRISIAIAKFIRLVTLTLNLLTRINEKANAPNSNPIETAAPTILSILVKLNIAIACAITISEPLRICLSKCKDFLFIRESKIIKV